VLSVSGVADAIHIATYYIGNILIEANERMPSSSNSTYRPSSVSRKPPHQGSSYVPGYSSSSQYGGGGGGGHQNPPQQLQTQQIYIPNDLVGCIIGKGGAKINEIRHMSASQIKIMEPGAVGTGINGAPLPAGGEGERLVVITGQPANIQMAVQLLYHVSLDILLRHIMLNGWNASAWNRKSKSSSGRRQIKTMVCALFVQL
jgi:heterogeneous nuclear rnp K-like protein